MRVHSHLLFQLGLAAATAVQTPAQVPDGFYVFGSFQGLAGTNGIFFAHPRDPLRPIIDVTNLPPALAYDPTGRRGVACLAYRQSDGALIAGERSPPGTSVDLHVLHLQGSAVVYAQLFSMGTSVGAGEIPQCALLSDGRIVVAATDLAAGGALAQFQTQQYNWEGLGIVDTESGGVTPLAIPNLNQFPGVINGLAVSLDGTAIYVGNYISATSGDLWRVPVAGGAATQVATFPCGPSNVAIDNDGTVLVVTLNGPPNLFRHDPVANTTTPITTVTGPMNCIAVERVSGNYAVATANAGLPPRSLYWISPAGQETLLSSPNRATIAAIDVNPNPEAFGVATAGQAEYSWELAPNQGGLPLVGNTGFSLTVRASNGVPSTAVLVVGSNRLLPGLPVLGATIHVDPGNAFTIQLPFQYSQTMPLPLPNLNSLRGVRLYAQSVHYEGGGSLAASPGLELTIL
jgi:hypothetical protein